MEMTRLAAPVMLSALLASGCGVESTGPLDQEMQALVGAWQATKFEYLSHAESGGHVNLASLGARVNVAIGERGDWTLLIGRPGMLLYEVSTGSLSSIRDSTVLLHWEGYPEPMTFVFGLLDDVLTMRTSDAQYDFDTDGMKEPADLAMILHRL